LSTAAVQAKPTEATRPVASGLFAEPGKRAFVLSLLLVAATLMVYNQAAHFSFVNFDDDRYITDNPMVQGGLTWSTVKWALTTTDVANWHPLTWLSHALDCQLFHLNPAGHHLTSVGLHGLNAVLVFLLLWRATRRLGRSFFVAMVFALNPLNVESVAWISERKNVLSTLFFLLTLGAYGWYAKKPDWKRYLAVSGLFVCALAAKPMVVTLPFVLLLVDYWPLGRIEGWTPAGDFISAQRRPIPLGLEKIPLLAFAAASSLVTMHAQRAAGAVSALPFPFLVRLKNALYSYLLYLGKAVWPAKLAPLYPHPGYSLAGWKPIAGALFLLGASFLVVKFRSRGYLVTGWLWFLGTLVPVIGLVQVGNQAMADRYTYIPFLGLFVMAAWGFGDLGGQTKARASIKVIAAASVVVVLALLSHRQAGYWRDSLSLWDHALAVTRNNFVAEDELGGALVDRGRTDEAYPHFLRAAQLAPQDPVSHSNIGAYLHQHGHPAEAIPQYDTAISLTSDARVLATTYANLGAAYSDLGDYPQSEAAFQASIRLNPRRFTTWLGKGLLARREGNLAEAMRDFVRSIQVEPSPQGYLELGRTLVQSGRNADALVAYELALKMDPDIAEAQQAVAQLRPRTP
jgi:protein O-mannosyl-transferase